MCATLFSRRGFFNVVLFVFVARCGLLCPVGPRISGPLKAVEKHVAYCSSCFNDTPQLAPRVTLLDAEDDLQTIPQS
jgi:hypothetical protein